MVESAAEFKTRLISRTGLSDAAITAAWPDWWSDAAEASPSAHAELRFAIARKLGLDARSLVTGDAPTFVWNDAARFKGFSGDMGSERPVISSFGMSLARMLIAACPHHGSIVGLAPSELRRSILASSPDVGLMQLIATAWGLGVPVIHLRVYPLAAKRMSAMSVRVGDRFAILIARDSIYPAPVAFHLAHELGHIALGHLADGGSIVDLDEMGRSSGDPEESAADAYALEVLTGRAAPEIIAEGGGRSARRLAQEARRVGEIERIEPGTLALTYGFATQQWPTALKALEHIYAQPHDVWQVLNRIASRQLMWSALPDESESFLRAVMGGLNG